MTSTESGDDDSKLYDIAYSKQSKSTVMMSGELKKRGKFNKSWKHRWFELSFTDGADSLFLSYYESKLHKKPCGSIKIADIYQIMAIDNDSVNLPPHSFILSSPFKQYIFSALNECDLTQWIYILNKYINGTRVVFEGYLMLKKEKTSNVWNRQYFILNQQGQLKYYKNKQKGTNDAFCGCILLSQIDEIAHGKVYDDVCVFTLNLLSKSMKRKWVLCYQDKLHCLLYSKKMRDKWQEKIQQTRFKQVDRDYFSDEIPTKVKKKKTKKKTKQKHAKVRRAKSYTLHEYAKKEKKYNYNHKNERKSRKKTSEKKRKVPTRPTDTNRRKYVHGNRGKKLPKESYNNVFAASKLSKISVTASHHRCNSDPTTPQTPKLKSKGNKLVGLSVFDSTSRLTPCGESAHANVEKLFEINPKNVKKKKKKRKCMSDIAKISKNRYKMKQVHNTKSLQSVTRGNKDKKGKKKAKQFSQRKEQFVRGTNGKWKYGKETNVNVAGWQISTPQNVSNVQFDVDFV